MAAKPNEIEITRVYDAPVKLVWAAWTDLKHVEKWWGPRGFTLTTKSKDLRPGGKWIYTMHGPDGTDYPNIATYHEVVKHEKLVYDHGGNEERQKLFTVTVTFREEKGKTVMHMTMTLDTAEAARETKKFIKKANGNSTWDRLGEYLGNETEGKDFFIINRSFPAAPHTLFEMWANPEHLAKWLAPAGSTMAFLHADVREGGRSLWSMTDSSGGVMYGQLHHRKIVAPKLLVYAQNFCDKNGERCKPPFAPSYPETVLTTVTFAPEEAGTRVTVRWEIEGEASAAERKTFHEMKGSMTGGWNGSFDKLDSLLEDGQKSR